ncbi:MAG: methyltransferase domain-containing protein [Lagierella massiliensis]|nr:methyltransferase domain-containing protein [Lagierella massiliensis]
MYEDFAKIYDRLTFDIDYENYQDIIKQNIKLKKGSNILEIGIGTGNMTKYFIDYAYKYLGLDPSSKMLEIASNKLSNNSNLTLLNIGIEELNYSEYFDFAFTTLDTINYLDSLELLKKSFTNVYNSLKKGAFFSFDLNSLNKIEKVLGNNCYIYEYENIFYTWQNFYDPILRKVNMVLDFFIQNDGKYERITEEQIQTYYSDEIIKKILEDIGFKNIIVKDLDTGQGVNQTSQRILIVSQK